MLYKKTQKHIEIVRSDTPGLSSMGKTSSDALYNLLKRHYETVGVTIVSNEAALRTIIAKQPDLVFLGVKYVPDSSGAKVWLSEYLEDHGIAYTGSPKDAIELEQNKTLAKRCVHSAGITTSPYVTVEHGARFTAPALGASLQFPLFVKPVDLGAGKGIDDSSVVHTMTELNVKTNLIYTRYGTSALVERYLPGREFSVAILKAVRSDTAMAMPLELIAPPNIRGDRILSKAIKSADVETVLPVSEPALRASLIELAKRAFVALGARDYGRIDIRLDSHGIPHFLEANLVPCLIGGLGNFPKACLMNIGMDYEDMILHIIDLAFARSSDAIAEEVLIGSNITLLPLATVAL